MDTALADRLAARHHLHSQGWIARRSEHFRHLPPPALEAWIGPEPDAPACEAPALSGAGWLLQPVGPAATAGVDARWLDALDPAQRNALFADLPGPGDGEAAPFAWAHRALCRQGLRLRIHTPPGKATADCDTVWLHLHHQPRDTVEAPLLVLALEPGVRCVLIETHDRAPSACAHPLVQNFCHAHLC